STRLVPNAFGFPGQASVDARASPLVIVSMTRKNNRAKLIRTRTPTSVPLGAKGEDRRGSRVQLRQHEIPLVAEICGRSGITKAEEGSNHQVVKLETRWRQKTARMCILCWCDVM